MDLKPNMANFFSDSMTFFWQKKSEFTKRIFGCEFGFFFGIHHLAERIGWHIATVVAKAQLMEQQLPFVFVRELSGRERFPVTALGRARPVQDVPGLAGQGSHPSLQEPRPPRATVRWHDVMESLTMNYGKQICSSRLLQIWVWFVKLLIEDSS